MENEKIENTINCEEACINGCILGDKCPNLQYAAQASQFISETSLDKMRDIADEAVRKKMIEKMKEPPKWVIPEFPD